MRHGSTSVQDQRDSTPATAQRTDVATSIEGPPVGACKPVRALCKRCVIHVGDFFNRFHRISGTYYLPVLLGSWTSKLRPSSEVPHRAAVGTELEGCTIEPHRCPGCPVLLGFRVLQAPKHKAHFQNREFFKLSRILLQYKVNPDTGATVLVEPYVNPDETPPSTQSPQEDPPAIAAAPSGEPDVIMEAQAQPHPDMHSRHSTRTLPSPASAGLPPNGLQRSASGNSGLPASPAHRHEHYAQAPTRESSATLASHTRELPPINHPPPMSHGAYSYPRSPHESHLEAVERMQKQIPTISGSQMQEREMGALRTMAEHNSSDLRQLEEAFQLLRREVQACNDNIHALHQRLTTLETRPPPSAVPPAFGEGSALEMMNERIHHVSQKVVEVDTLKATILILKDQVRRLEEERIPRHDSHAATALVHPSYSMSQPPVHIEQIHRPSYYPSPSGQVLAEPERHDRAASVQAPPSAWTSVNAGGKRSYTNGGESPHTLARRSVSPKRPKLAPSGQPVDDQPLYEVLPSNASRVSTHVLAPVSTPPVYTAPPQQQPREAAPDTPTPTSHPPSYPQVFSQFPVQETPSPDIWRQKTQPPVQPAPRTRGRPRGPNSRGGRRNKPLISQDFVMVETPIGTEHWTTTVSNPDLFHPETPRSQTTARRGSGSSAMRSAGRDSSVHRPVLGMQGVSPGGGVLVTQDPYAHTKKTRTKPIRNADGVLIRKDGQPDKRSQSSAANLKRVHARKEEQRMSGAGSGQNTPVEREGSGLRYELGRGAGSGESSPEGLDDITRKRHDQVIGMMFPNGIESARRETDYARVFEDDGEHVAVPRGHGHHAGHGEGKKGRKEVVVKREDGETEGDEGYRGGQSGAPSASATPKTRSPGVRGDEDIRMTGVQQPADAENGINLDGSGRDHHMAPAGNKATTATVDRTDVEMHDYTTHTANNHTAPADAKAVSAVPAPSDSVPRQLESSSQLPPSAQPPSSSTAHASDPHVATDSKPAAV
ncbi:hypothetical protein M011DRAFT_474081 [Sporormia fimetaria CBS 119925]|uniref:Uncharacterized protein n=1 Tax=Sporormia fimetaria CBS 119925 TaxID=1340428 RepID=A0A6A6VLG3_9PLEO|nr:hypothetical protein M011DRAFT_474081 [Sporormia fimetaria CBS 119925]